MPPPGAASTVSTSGSASRRRSSNSWAVKQGWSGFGESSDCADTTASAVGRRVTTASGAAVDLAGPALHTTGTVGAGDRSIIAVFTLHPGAPRSAPRTAPSTRWCVH
ncbi:hypothetical protein ACUXZZ_43440 [Streptomyces graminifolii]|uniref:hypothetical protein n=1 Tax=Streptomyces graminifolii TaxID=1266771 RepID=UPI004057CD9C